MAAEIDIIINADASKVAAELQKATNELLKLERQLKKSSDVTEIQNLQSNISKLRTEIDALNKTNSKLGGSSNKAAYALNDLSRIAQDAPYGFIGIQNNINPLLESFQRLKKETGSTGGALKAMAQGLAGPAGLGLAIGVVSAALTFASIGFDRWGAAAKKAKSDADEFQKGLDNAKSSALSTGLLLEGYVKIARDQTKSEDQRNAALKEANKILGEHGEKLTLANVATEKVTDSVKLYTQATIAQAIAQKYSDKIADLIIKKTELQAKATQLKAEASIQSSKLTQQANNLLKRSYGTSDKAAYDVLQTQDALNNAQDATVKNATEIANANTEITDTQNQLNKALNESTNFFGELGFKAKDGTKKAKKAVETIESVLAKLRKDIADENILANIIGTPRFEVIQKDFKLVEEAITKLVKKFNLDTSDRRLLKLQIQISNLQARLKPAEIQKYAKKTKEELEQALFKELVGIKVLPDIKIEGGVENLGLEDIADSLESFMKSTATNIAQVFSDTFANILSGTATFGNFFQSLFNTLGKAVEQLGTELVSIGAAALIAKLALDQVLVNPYALIAAGIALTALGALISQTTSKQRFAVGTRNAPGGMALVGERGPELVNLPRGSQVIPAAQTSNMMGGVGGSVEVFGILRGQDIYFSNKKYGQTYGRTT